ncbi:hypothetical protein ACFW0G_43015, partial [Amycolatopsis sp. NPDC058986]
MRAMDGQPPGSPAANTPSRRPLVLAALAGFALGGGVFGLLWALSGVHAGALEDARAACGALDRVGSIPDTTRSGSGRSPTAQAPRPLHPMHPPRALEAA